MSDERSIDDSMCEMLRRCDDNPKPRPAPTVEDIFREVALMSSDPTKDEDPYQSEAYQKFVESMVELCRCTPFENRPCDGVLAGGICDDMHFDNPETHSSVDFYE